MEISVLFLQFFILRSYCKIKSFKNQGALNCRVLLLTNRRNAVRQTGMEREKEGGRMRGRKEGREDGRREKRSFYNETSQVTDGSFGHSAFTSSLFNILAFGTKIVRNPSIFDKCDFHI